MLHSGSYYRIDNGLTESLNKNILQRIFESYLNIVPVFDSYLPRLQYLDKICPSITRQDALLSKGIFSPSTVSIMFFGG